MSGWLRPHGAVRVPTTDAAPPLSDAAIRARANGFCECHGDCGHKHPAGRCRRSVRAAFLIKPGFTNKGVRVRMRLLDGVRCLLCDECAARLGKRVTDVES